MSSIHTTGFGPSSWGALGVALPPVAPASRPVDRFSALAGGEPLVVSPGAGSLAPAELERRFLACLCDGSNGADRETL